MLDRGNMKFKGYTSQVDEMDCGVAALSSVLKYYGTEKSIASLRTIVGTTNSGTTLLGLAMAAENLRFDTKTVRADLNLFERNLVFPFIVDVIKEEKYLHYYVIYKAKDDYLVLGAPDPTVKVHKMNFAQFSAECNCIALFLIPGNDYRAIKDKSPSLLNYSKVLLRQRKNIFWIVLTTLIIIAISISGTFFYSG